MVLLFCLVGWIHLAVADTTLPTFSDAEIQAEIKNIFSEKAQSTPPLKKDADGLIQSTATQGISIKDKQAWRENFLPQENANIFSEPTQKDDARKLIEGVDYVESLLDMEKRNLLNGRSNVQPWSDDYWPFFKGGPAWRYADKYFPRSNSWQTNRSYISSNPFQAVYQRNPEWVDILSPAEKYDLLFDDREGALSRALWQEGARLTKAMGKLETWMGICHGWAPASFMVPRPTRAVDVVAFDGRTRIRFYPDDIKALHSLLWAVVKTPVHFVGGRCNQKNPRANHLGRPVDPDCLDNNPATWHKVVVNRVGLAKDTFIMDSTYDFQVWNQPVVAYSYKYFNPQTMQTTNTASEAFVKTPNFSEDKFRQYRSRSAYGVVGISMQLTYVAERRPKRLLTDTPQNDTFKTVLYIYDLEVDRDGKILGGEWYKTPHPDFLWAPDKTAQALANTDYLIANEPLWNGQTPLPQQWKTNGQSAARVMQPMKKILDSLSALAR